MSATTRDRRAIDEHECPVCKARVTECGVVVFLHGDPHSPGVLGTISPSARAGGPAFETMNGAPGLGVMSAGPPHEINRRRERLQPVNIPLLVAEQLPHDIFTLQ